MPKLLPLVLLSLSMSFSAWADERGQLAQREKELKTLQSRINSISTRLGKEQSKHHQLSRDLSKIEKRSAALHSALNTLKKDLRRAKTAVTNAKAQREQQKIAVQQQYRQLSRQLRAAHVIGHQAQTRMLLSQQDPSRLARMGRYFDYFQKAQQSEIAAFESELKALKAREESLQLAQSELQALTADKEQTLKAIGQQKKQREQALDRLAAAMNKGGAELAQLRTEQANLESLIGALQDAVQDLDSAALRKGFRKQRGKLNWPVRGPILASFGSRKKRLGGKWNGIWIGAEEGSPVRSIASGRLIYAGWMHRYGLLLVVDHGDNYFSLYGHNQAALKSVGDDIQAGETIAQAGNTGGHDKTGLYLEIRKGRQSQNPKRWLKKP